MPLWRFQELKHLAEDFIAIGWGVHLWAQLGRINDPLSDFGRALSVQYSFRSSLLVNSVIMV